MRTTIYLVRHGDVHNPNKIMYERLPGFRLSNLGREQAHALGKFLSTKKIHTIYASPMERTVETATIVSSYHNGVLIQRDERLIEVATVARGRSLEELAGERWNFYQKKYTSQGGESLSAIWKRMRIFLYEAAQKHQGQEIIVVSHGDPIMISMIKHMGLRLSLSNIRGSQYVGTARGFVLEFEMSRPMIVQPLEF